MTVDVDEHEEPFYKPDRKPDRPRQPTPGLKVWELRRNDRMLVCELRDDQRAGAGIDVQVLDADRWPMLTWRCVNRAGAEFIAASYRREFLREGWTESGAAVSGVTATLPDRPTSERPPTGPSRRTLASGTSRDYATRR